MKTIAVLPLRGGSKSIPRKNIKPFAGKPLFQWTALAALEAEGIDALYIATDDAEIEAAARAMNHPRLEVFQRSAATATDTATTESVLLEVAQQVDAERMLLIQATSPLLTSADLADALKKFEQVGADSMLSVVEQKRFFWKENSDGSAQAVNYEPAARPRRQEFDGQLVENGAFYIFTRQGLMDSGCRLHGRVAVHEMPEETYFELDEPSDWIIAEKLLENAVPRNEGVGSRDEGVGPIGSRDEGRGTSGTHSTSAPSSVSDECLTPRPSPLAPRLSSRARNIRLFLTDVDGVLTDAGMYYSEKGDELKKFNTRDAVGLRLLREAGIKVGIITSEDTQIVARRAKKMGVDFLIQGAKNKADELDKILAETGLSAEQVAFIGDDINDLTIFAKVGFTATPADGQPAVRAKAHYICQAKGGEGAVREIAEKILES